MAKFFEAETFEDSTHKNTSIDKEHKKFTRLAACSAALGTLGIAATFEGGETAMLGGGMLLAAGVTGALAVEVYKKIEQESQEAVGNSQPPTETGA